MNNVTRLGWIGVIVAMSMTCLGGEPAKPAPEFQEIYELLRSHLKSMDAVELNRAAVEGLLQALHPKVTLLPAQQPGAEGSGSASVVKAEAYEDAYGYFRLGEVASGAARELREAYDRLNSQRRLEGMIIDLRFADGSSYPSAAEVADLFFSAKRPMVQWGEAMQESTTKENALRLPVAILVNSKTSGAAEVLAGILREGGVGLVLGGSTAGLATEFQDFTLKDGQRLRLATNPIKLGSGKQLPSTGLKPDISVAVRLEDEEVYLKDAYAKIPGRVGVIADSSAQTNESSRLATNLSVPRLNEAELMRRHREGLEPEPDELVAEPSTAEPQEPVLRDPVLARALDLLKGLALIHVKPSK